MLDPLLSDPLFWRALAKALVLPPTGLLLLSLVGFAMMRAHRRGGRALALAGVLVLVVLSMPAVGAFLLRVVYAGPAFDPARTDGARAVVILGGGVRRDAPEYGGDTLGRLTLERVRYGARVARQTSLPVLVSGGTGISGGASEASLMRAALETEYAVPVRWAEDQSRTTRENAQKSAAILRAEGIDRVVLVAHAFDMPRAMAEFAEAGVTCIAAPTGLSPEKTGTLLDFVPMLAGLTASYYAIYELLGEQVRRLTASR